MLQNVKEKNEIAEAEVAGTDSGCGNCPAPTVGGGSVPAFSSSAPVKRSGTKVDGPVFRAAVDEVSIFFSATDHGKSVTDLTQEQVVLRDNSQLPEKIHAFRNQAQLPLRLGLIIDISDSVTGRLSFEQEAAAKFLETVVTNKEDEAFVLGVNNSVLLVQDFTGRSNIDGTLGQSTGAWRRDSDVGCDRVWRQKLASRAESQPVARILVVISDGEDNSSKY